MIGIVVPANDEEAHLGHCLASLQRAARCPSLQGEPVFIVVVADACTDGTADIARSMGATALECGLRNVGAARALGAEFALAQGAGWLAFTDADTRVAPDWLSEQRALRSDAVCGTVAVLDWSEHDIRVKERHAVEYIDADGHRHIPGANLGVSAAAYRRAGGFPPLACSEDVALVDALQASGASIAWSAAPRVTTSSRRSYRARGGFGATLERMGRELHPGSHASSHPSIEVAE